MEKCLPKAGRMVQGLAEPPRDVEEHRACSSGKGEPRFLKRAPNNQTRMSEPEENTNF